MGKIIKKSVEKIILNKTKFSLGMKGEFKIEFASDSFGPYNYKFQKEDCYFIDGLEDRGTLLFPLKNNFTNNTEIFLENDDIVIAIGKRGTLVGEDKNFIDIINIKTEKKYRLFTNNIGLIFNSKDKIIVNAVDEGEYKTLVLDMESMKKNEEHNEELQAFFKVVYNKTTNEWFCLDYSASDKNESDEDKKYKNGFFTLQQKNIKGIPKSFDRKKFEIKTDRGIIDVWERSKS